MSYPSVVLRCPNIMAFDEDRCSWKWSYDYEKTEYFALLGTRCKKIQTLKSELKFLIQYLKSVGTECHINSLDITVFNHKLFFKNIEFLSNMLSGKLEILIFSPFVEFNEYYLKDSISCHVRHLGKALKEIPTNHQHFQPEMIEKIGLIRKNVEKETLDQCIRILNRLIH